MTETNQQFPAPQCDPDRTNGGADLFSSPSTKAPSWRDLVAVHPAAALFPAMADAELDELGKDIIKYGLILKVGTVLLGTTGYVLIGLALAGAP